MKTTLIVIGVMIAMGAFFFLNKPGSDSANNANFDTVQADIQSGGQLIDVRTPSEYAAGHIKGAINLSLQDMQAGSLPKVAKTQTVYVYCRSGSRSGTATSLLKNAGYQNVGDLGAMSRVQAMGGAVAN